MENVKESRSRYSSIDWFGELREITVGGVGTIGSNLSMLLARGGDHTIIMYDDDVVDIQNLSGQLFNRSHIGRSKVEVMKELLLSFTEIDDKNVHIMDNRIEEGTYVSKVCFSCFDNMKARRAAFDNWKKLEDREIFIDGRMNIESYEVYCVTPDTEDRYEQSLFSDDEVGEQICSLKNTTHTGFLIAGRMMTSFTNHLSNSKLGFDMREVPFYFREDMCLQEINMN